MSLQTDITTGIQTISAVGPVTGTYNAAALAAPFEVKVQVPSFTGVSALVVLESSAAGTFADAVVIQDFPIGNTNAAAEQWFSVPSYQLAGASFGSANNKFRLRLASISGGSLQVRGMVFA